MGWPRRRRRRSRSFDGPVSSSWPRRRSRRAARERRTRLTILTIVGLCLLALFVYEAPWRAAPVLVRTPTVVADLPPMTRPVESVAAPATAAPAAAAAPVGTLDFDLPPVVPPPLSPELMAPVVAMLGDEVPAELREMREREMGVETLDVDGGLISIEPGGGIPEPLAGLVQEQVEARTLVVPPTPTPRRQTAALPVPVVPPTPGPAGGARVAIIIDDLGPAHSWSARAIALPGPLTMSFLPYAEGLAEQTENARRHGHEIFLHMPMQPLGDANPGRNALRSGMSAADIRQRVEWAIDRVGTPVGMNNHMGSRMTADAQAMQVVMEVLRGHGLMFVDSRTSPHSVAEGVAAEAGLPHTGRDVFLDHFPGPAFVRRQLGEVEARARRTGTVVAIGHPLPTTMEVLEDWIPAAKARGLRFVKVSEVIAARGCNGDTATGKCGLLHVAGQRQAPGGG